MLTAAIAVAALRNWPARRVVLIGTSTLSLGVAVSMIGIYQQQVAALLAGTMIAGAGFGSTFAGTLRAQLGDKVQLTFLNQINPGDFGDSIDRGERGQGCDESSAPYPGLDKFPDCFHGSSTGNIHFHGTHTSPSTTGDDVAEWDSANHVLLMVAVESEFGVRFEPDEITAPQNVGELVDLIRAKLGG